jgi:predicted protein tyrosine phosphatase
MQRWRFQALDPIFTAMKQVPTSLLTICGLEELGHHSSLGVTHVISILDPEWPEPEAFGSYDSHHRTTLRFHDVIEPGPDLVLPKPEHVEAVLDFGAKIIAGPAGRADAHLLVHCHMGISRSTAAMAMLLAQSNRPETEEGIFAHLLELRPQAWPNSLMIEFADDLLGRGGRLINALGGLYAQQLAKRPETEEFMRTHGRLHEVEMARRAPRV